jgi:hypothetical protein
MMILPCPSTLKPEFAAAKINWSEGDALRRLAKYAKVWDDKTGEAVDENDEAISLRQFAFVIYIPYITFKKYVCEDLEKRRWRNFVDLQSSVATIPCWFNVINTSFEMSWLAMIEPPREQTCKIVWTLFKTLFLDSQTCKLANTSRELCSRVKQPSSNTRPFLTRKQQQIEATSRSSSNTDGIIFMRVSSTSSAAAT